jgi:hypothetical protein
MIEGSPPFTLDWLTLGNPDEPDDAGVEWHLLKVAGITDGGTPRMDITERPAMHGAAIGPIFMKERIITLEGRAFAPDFASLRHAEMSVKGLCSGSSTESYPLTLHSEIGDLTCSVRLDDKITTVPNKVFAPSFDFSIQLVAADPLIYSAETYSKRAGLPPATVEDGLDFLAEATFPDSGTGLDFGTGAPDSGLSFGTQSAAAFAWCYNQGTAPSPPIVTIHGPLTTPTVTSSAGPYELTYNDTLAAGEFVVINPQLRTVLLGGTASRRWLLNPAHFAGFTVPAARGSQPGLLKVGVTHQGPSTETGWVEVTYRDAYF